jgi:Plasmid pRiA4b ORF-3-like protein
MSATIPFKRLILRAVLRDVSPMVARLISVSDETELSDLHDVFQQVLGWSGDLGYSFRIHGKEFNSFRGRTRSKPLQEFRLHRQEKFLYICDLLDIWEWELRIMDIQEVDATDEREPVCLGGRGAAPPKSCGGPRGYRLMLKRQQQGASVSDPALVEATIQLFSASRPEQPASTWSLSRDAVRERWQNVDRRLLEHGPLEPDRFNLQEANERLAMLSRRGGIRL